MKSRLSDRLSPRAKKAALRVQPGERVHVLLSVSAKADLAELRRALEALGAEISSISPETRTVAAAVPGDALSAVAAMREITYVDAASAYTR
jgi:hypothetical protein